jgi:flagellin-like protein
MAERSRGVSPVISVILLVAVVVILAGTLSVFVLGLGESVSDAGPTVEFRIEYNYFGDGVEKNDSVRITHIAGDKLDREQLEIMIDSKTVYNETADSETTSDTKVIPGLVVEVDAGDFNDLNKPCTLNGELVSPRDTCGGPPGDGDGSDNGTVLEWTEEVEAGQSLVIQERNDPQSYDVMEPGDKITIIYRGDGFSAVLAEETVAPRESDD